MCSSDLAVFGKGGKIITTREGEAYVKSKGLDTIVVSPEDRACVRGETE